MEIDLNGMTHELTTKQIELYDALTENEKTFVLCKISGMSNYESFLPFTISTNRLTIMKSASKMAGGHRVRAFLNEMSRVRFSQAIMTREEMAARLSKIARTEITDIVTTNTRELMDVETGEIVNAQTTWSLKPFDEMENGGVSAISELSATNRGLTIKTHSQITAAKQLAELMGYNKPQQLEVSVAKSLDDLYDDFEAEEAASAT